MKPVQPLLALAALIGGVLMFPAPAHTQGEDKRIKKYQKQITDLRKRLSRTEDDMLEMARRFDKEKKRLRDEIKALQQGKGGGAPAPRRTLGFSFDFNKSGKKGMKLSALVSFLKKQGTTLRLDGLHKSHRVELRLKGVTVPQLMDAVVLNTKHRKTKKWMNLTWRQEGKGKAVLKRK